MTGGIEEFPPPVFGPVIRLDQPGDLGRANGRLHLFEAGSQVSRPPRQSQPVEQPPVQQPLHLVGEIGGRSELDAAELVARMTTPLVAYVAGRHAPPGKRMGHAGALLGNEDENVDGKTSALREAGALIVNRPQALRDMNEKAYAAWFPECTPATLITRSMQEMKAFLAEHGHIVVKPLDAMGGRSIFVVRNGDSNATVIFETVTVFSRRYAMAQVFIPEISAGDKRILLINGEPVPYALARIPPADDFRGNLVTGAKGVGREVQKLQRVGHVPHPDLLQRRGPDEVLHALPAP